MCLSGHHKDDTYQNIVTSVSGPDSEYPQNCKSDFTHSGFLLDMMDTSQIEHILMDAVITSQLPPSCAPPSSGVCVDPVP